MYSVVLMAAMTAGTSTPDWLFHGCWGCHGCYGSCHGCYGSCSGCYGGCHGCYGSCYGCYGGAWSSCYGCCGGGGGCGGWSSCYGCCGGGGWSCQGCYGSCHGSYGNVIYSAPVGGAPVVVPGGQMMKPASMAPVSTPAAATISVAKLSIDMPATAQLYVDDQPIKAVDNKVYTTPKLEFGQSYFYV